MIIVGPRNGFQSAFGEITQEKNITMLQEESEITRKQLAEMIEITSDGVKYNLEKLRRLGLIRHVGVTKRAIGGSRMSEIGQKEI